MVNPNGYISWSDDDNNIRSAAQAKNTQTSHSANRHTFLWLILYSGLCLCVSKTPKQQQQQLQPHIITNQYRHCTQTQLSILAKHTHIYAREQVCRSGLWSGHGLHIRSELVLVRCLCTRFERSRSAPIRSVVPHSQSLFYRRIRPIVLPSFI